MLLPVPSISFGCTVWPQEWAHSSPVQLSCMELCGAQACTAAPEQPGASQCLGTRTTELSLLFSPQGKGADCQQDTIGFPLVRFSVSGAQGTSSEDCKGHSLSLCETSSEVVGQIRCFPNPGGNCCNSAFFWKTVWCLLLFGRNFFFPL